jgi:hypothetical protein
MKSLRLIALVGLSLVAIDAIAAQFKVTNSSSGTIWFKPFLGATGCEQYYQELKQGESRNYDTGFAKVNEVRWIQKYPQASACQLPGVLSVKSFKQASTLSMNALELGVKIDILNDGSFKIQRILQPDKTETAETMNGF